MPASALRRHHRRHPGPGHDPGEALYAALPCENRMRLIGPNCAGIISPGKSLLGIMPGNIYLQGHIGIVGRSGTLGYEAAAQMKELGIGISTSVGIGGDPINGSSFKRHPRTVRERSRHPCG